MTQQEAIVARHSVRQYFDKPIEAEKIQQLYRHDMQERRFRQAQGPSLRDAELLGGDWEKCNKF